MNEPIFILVRPQMGENIGASARALLNCGLRRMRLVAPRDGWPNPKAWPCASGAQEVLEKAEVFETVEEAVADLSIVFATTARSRDLIKEVFPLDQAARSWGDSFVFEKTGILFGSERTGLENSELSLATHFLTIPLNPSFSSLNLSQAVLLVAYTFLQVIKEERPASYVHLGETRWASRGEVHSLFQRFQGMTREASVLDSPRSEHTWLNFENFLHRLPLTWQDVQSFHRILTLLEKE